MPKITIKSLHKFIDNNHDGYHLDQVRQGQYGKGQLTKFWPYKLAGILVYGEVAGVRKLPGRLILAPLPVVYKICPTKQEKIREHLAAAVDLGLFEAIEFYSNHALITVAETPWETGQLDVVTFGDDLEPDPTHHSPSSSPEGTSPADYLGEKI
jgi:hypothetical protein